ncbi:MAG: hypothetical protein ACHQ0Y_00820 [Thermodesulfovibrionales bacterium]
MKKFLLLLLPLSIIILAGCGIASREIAQRSVSESVDVFHEVRDGDITQEGFVDLVVMAQIKTPLEGRYLLESKKSPHGKPTYTFLFNVDGQAVTWDVRGQKEGDNDFELCMMNHDCGEGMRYVLEKKVRLKEGAHKIFFALPGDNYRTEFEITLKRNEPNNLECKPVYRNQKYFRGIVRFDVFINNTQVPQETGGRRPLLDW